MPEWIYLDDGYAVEEHVTACLLEWEWLQVQEEAADGVSSQFFGVTRLTLTRISLKYLRYILLIYNFTAIY